MDSQDLVDLQGGHGQGDQGNDLVAFLQVEAGLILQILADVSDDTLEHTAGTGDRILLLAALSDDAQDHFADLLLIAAAGLGNLGEGSGVDVQGSDVADDLVGVNLGHVVVDLPCSLGQNALGLNNAVGTVLVAFQFSHCNIPPKNYVNVFCDYFRGLRLRISRASAGVAISRPSSLAMRTTLATSSPLEAALCPLPR